MSWSWPPSNEYEALGWEVMYGLRCRPLKKPWTTIFARSWRLLIRMSVAGSMNDEAERPLDGEVVGALLMTSS